ncbi:MAG TPA: LysM peptidoglycan-binding domain-containing protein [Pseudolabrys sp.]|nr:LysM peptidoglycan-binding domain-containing protein [Pseudolabrys sp.]
MQPVQTASCVAAAILAGCTLCAALERTPAASGAPPREPVGAILDINPASAATGSLGKAPATYAPAVPLPPAPPAAAVPAEPVRTYLFRGALGLIFSRGMDRLTERVVQAGLPAKVNEFTVCRYIAEEAIRDYRQKPAPIALIGHSMGGLCALKFAEMLQAENIPVSLVVTIDPAHLMPKVPLNVERYINIYLAHDVLGGGDARPENGYQGHYASFDLSKQAGVLHVNIEKMNTLHAQIVAKLRDLAATPAKAEGEGVPLRYTVPRDAAIELWDSGVPVYVRAGDTLQTLAASFRVPLWSLMQVNNVPENAALAANQRIVVPRHLVPLAALSQSPPPPGR